MYEILRHPEAMPAETTFEHMLLVILARSYASRTMPAETMCVYIYIYIYCLSMHTCTCTGYAPPALCEEAPGLTLVLVTSY